MLTFFLNACMQDNTPPQPPETEIIPFTVIESGNQSGIHPETHTLTAITDDTAWKAFWSQHKTITPIPSAPKVDFTQQMVIAVVDTDQPNSGYTLHMDKIEQHDQELWVHVTREQPASGCLNLGMVSQPYVLVTIPHQTTKPKLIFVTHTYDC
jgi:hypothetical protein